LLWLITDKVYFPHSSCRKRIGWDAYLLFLFYIYILAQGEGVLGFYISVLCGKSSIENYFINTPQGELKIVKAKM